MKKLTFILILITLLSCKDKVVIVVPEFTERDAYEIINKLYIEQIHKHDTIIYWNNRQLQSPSISNTDIYFDDIPLIESTLDPFPRFTSKFWDTDKLKGVNIVTSKEFDYYFQENDSIDLEQLWNTTYNYDYVHNVSYPIYNPETKVAIIKDYTYKPFMFCGTDVSKTYLFKKTEAGWEKL